MKLIMENWRNYQETESSLILFENQINEEVDVLISEGVMDLVAAAYERAKDGALKLKDTISDKVKAALERVNDFFLKMAIKAMNLARTSIDAMMRVASSMNSAIERFQKSHPILYNMVKAVIFMIVIAGIVAVFSSEASAAVKLGGGKEMSQDRYNAIRGFLDSYMDNRSDIGIKLDVGSAISDLDMAYKSKNPDSINNLPKYIRLANKYIEGYINDARAGDKDAYSELVRFKEIGEKLKIIVTGM